MLALCPWFLMYLVYLSPVFMEDKYKIQHLAVYPGNDLAIGIMEIIAVALGDHQKIEVVPFDSMLKDRRNLLYTDGDPLQFCQELGVDAVLTGKLVKVPEGLRFEGVFAGPDYQNALRFEALDSRLLVREMVNQVAQSLALEGVSTDLAANLDTDVLDLYRLGSILKSEGRFLSAAALFEEALQKDTSFALAGLRLAQCLFVLGELNRSEEVSRSMLDHRSAHLRIQALELRHNVLAHQEHLGEAQRVLAQALAEGSQNGLTRLLPSLYLAQANLMQGYGADMAEVARLIDNAYQAHALNHNRKGMAEVAILAARHRMRMSGAKDEVAIRYLNEARQWADKIPYPQLQGSIAYVGFYGARAIGLRQKERDLDHELALLQKAESIFLNIGSVFSFVRVRSESMRIYMEKRDLTRAEQLGRELVELASQHGFFETQINVRNYLADIHRVRGDRHTAAHILEENLMRLKQRPFAHLRRNTYQRLVPIMVSLERFERALAYSDLWLKEIDRANYRQERLAFLLNNHGEILMRLGQFEEADHFLQRALEKKRKFRNLQSTAWTLRNLAGLNLHLRRLEKAKNYLEEIERLVPGDPAGLALQALIFAQEGESARGIRLLQNLLEAQPHLRKTRFVNLLNDLKRNDGEKTVQIFLPNHYHDK